MARKAVLKLTFMADAETRRKAMKAVAEVPGVSSVAVDIEQRKLTIGGEMDIIVVAKKLKKIGKKVKSLILRALTPRPNRSVGGELQ